MKLIIPILLAFSCFLDLRTEGFDTTQPDRLTYQIDTTRIFTDLAEALRNPEQVYRLHLPKKHDPMQVDTFPMEVFRLVNLEELNLRGSRFTYLPPEIGQLENLKHLDLSLNYLSQLPEEIGDVEKLETLNLGWNMNLSNFPNSFSRLTNLKRLEYSLCEFYHFPMVICYLSNLEYLDASKTGIDTIPPCIGNLTELKELYLYNNGISELPPEFGKLTSLEKLLIINNDIKQVPETFKNLKSLKYLTMYPDKELRKRLQQLLPNTDVN